MSLEEHTELPLQPEREAQSSLEPLTHHPTMFKAQAQWCWPLQMGEASWEEANRKTNITWELWTSFQTESPQIFLVCPLVIKRPSHEKMGDP